MTKLLQNCLLFVVGFLMIKIVSPVFDAMPVEQVFIEIKAKVSRGANMELFINKDWSVSWRQPVETNKMNNYRFPKIPERISSIRLDVTDATSGQIHLQEIQVVCPGQKNFPIPFNAAGWGFNDLKVNSISADGLILEAFGPDPWITIPVDLQLSSSFFAKLKGILKNQPLILYLAVWFLAMIVLSLFSGFRSLLIIASSTALFYFLILITLPLVLATTQELPSTGQAIGMAAYTGYSFESQKRGFFWILFCALFFAPGVVFASRKLRHK